MYPADSVEWHYRQSVLRAFRIKIEKRVMHVHIFQTIRELLGDHQYIIH